MLDQLRQLADCDRPWARERAAMAIMITEQYQGGGLDYGEYQELMQDLVRLDQVNLSAEDLELKTLLVQAVSLCARAV